MQRLNWMTMTLIGMVTLAMAEPPPAPGGASEGGKAGPAGGMEVSRERMRRLGGLEGEGLALRMLTSDARVAQELGLNDEQRKQIRDGVTGSTQDIKALNAQIEAAALRQAELMKADVLDEEAILKAVRDTGDLRTQIATIRIRQLLAAHKVLTPEQRGKVREIMERRMQQARQRLQEGGREAPFRGREGRGDRPGPNKAPPPPPPATPPAAE